MHGRFISLEGGEGVGKSTQLARLAEALRARGREVAVTREPGGSDGAEDIRKLLLEGAADRWTAETEALLFAAARADHVARRIRPALQRGAWVISDRFLDSSIAYQGGAGGVGEAAVRTLHAIGSAGLLPDRTILLQLPAATAAIRARHRDTGGADRIGGKDAGYHSAVARSFVSLADAEPERFRIIDANGSADEVAIRILSALEDLL